MVRPWNQGPREVWSVDYADDMALISDLLLKAQELLVSLEGASNKLDRGAVVKGVEQKSWTKMHKKQEQLKTKVGLFLKALKTVHNYQCRSKIPTCHKL